MALGQQGKLVGVSHSCRLPAAAGELPLVTSTRIPVDSSSSDIDSCVRDHLAGNAALYDLDVDRLSALAPDVIISQALCDVCAVSTGDVVHALQSLPSRPVLVDLEPNTLDDVFTDIARVGTALDCASAADALLAGLRARRAAVQERSARLGPDQRPGVAFLEWLQPPFNGGHWNPEILTLAGGTDLLGSPGRPSRTLHWDEVHDAKPDVILVASCGLSIERSGTDIRELPADARWNELPAVREKQVFVADGDRYFSCPGPALVDALESLAHLLHPALHPPASVDVFRQFH